MNEANLQDGYRGALALAEDDGADDPPTEAFIQTAMWYGGEMATLLNIFRCAVGCPDCSKKPLGQVWQEYYAQAEQEPERVALMHATADKLAERSGVGEWRRFRARRTRTFMLDLIRVMATNYVDNCWAEYIRASMPVETTTDRKDIN